MLTQAMADLDAAMAKATNLRSDEKKRGFIKATARPEQVFADLFDIARPQAKNEMSNQTEAPDPSNAINLYYAIIA